MEPKVAINTITEWKDYYNLQGTAGATLMGLLFVAVALNSDLILSNEHPQTKLRSEQAFQNYMTVVVISHIFLFPGVTRQAVALALILQSAIMVGLAAYRLFRTAQHRDDTVDPTHHWRRLLPSLVAHGLILYGCKRVLTKGEADAIQFLGFGTLLLLISATVTSWEMLVRIAEIRHRTGKHHRDQV